jgi:hypothetical protein
LIAVFCSRWLFFKVYVTGTDKTLVLVLVPCFAPPEIVFFLMKFSEVHEISPDYPLQIGLIPILSNEEFYGSGSGKMMQVWIRSTGKESFTLFPQLKNEF